MCVKGGSNLAGTLVWSEAASEHNPVTGCRYGNTVFKEDGYGPVAYREAGFPDNRRPRAVGRFEPETGVSVHQAILQLTLGYG